MILCQRKQAWKEDCYHCWQQPAKESTLLLASDSAPLVMGDLLAGWFTAGCMMRCSYSPGKLEARGLQEGSMLGNDKVLVLVHEQQRAVSDLAGVVVH